MQEYNTYKFVLLIVLLIGGYFIQSNIAADRKATILMFCTKQYDDHATSQGPNTYFGAPRECLSNIESAL